MIATLLEVNIDSVPGISLTPGKVVPAVHPFVEIAFLLDRIEVDGGYSVG